MAITPDNFKWADLDVNDPISGNPNKVEPDSSLKNSGLLAGEPLPRSYINYQFDEYHKAFVDLQAQINGLVLNSGSALLETIYHVGSIFMSKDSTSPATRFGFGTWARVKGRFLVGLDEADTAFDGAGEEGGSKTHTHLNTLSVGGHALTATEMPAHDHSYRDRYHPENSTVLANAPYKENMPFNYNNKFGSRGVDEDNNQFLYIDSTTDVAGSNQAHTHPLTGGITSATSLPPYKAYYIWERTA